MSQPSILVVEDDRNVRSVFKRALEREGYTVVTAEHGQQALDILRMVCKPDLILLDMLMPVMDGEEFLAIQKRDPELSKIPSVLISATSDLRAVAENVVMIKKPVNLVTFLEVIRQQLGITNESIVAVS